MGKLLSSNRIFIVPIIACLVLGLIFMSALYPMVKMSPKNLPLGLVVEDAGQTGATLAQNLLANAPEVVKFTQYDSMVALSKAMDEREAYGALVIPADFSSKLASLQSDAPEQATVQIYLNEGANSNAATVAQNALTTIVTMLNTTLSTQMLSNIPVPIEPGKVQLFANPIQSETIKVHEAGSLAMAPLGFLTTTWFVSLIGAVILYLIGSKRTFENKAAKLKFNTLQSIMPFVYALVAGYVVSWYSTWIYGFEFDNFNAVALFIALTISAFIYMIFATLRWLRLPSITIYILLMFFSMAAAQLPAEMVPSFFKDYVLSWLPLRFFVEGLREVLFFSNEVFNSFGIVLLWILVVGFVLVWIKNIVEKVKEPKRNVV